jgi:hypothetical protein
LGRIKLAHKPNRFDSQLQNRAGAFIGGLPAAMLPNPVSGGAGRWPSGSRVRGIDGEYILVTDGEGGSP